MSRRGSPSFWLFFLICVALAIWWVLYVPYAPKRLYAAIPAHAAFVSEHRDLVSRWDAVSKSPLTLSLCASMGLPPSDLDVLTKDPEARAWFRKLASKDVVLAYVPILGNRGEPAWVITSWLGGGSQRLRWLLSWKGLPGYTRCSPYHGRIYWIVENAQIEAGFRFTVTFVEGMLIGCLSRDPDTMRDVLDTYDGLIPSMTGNALFPMTGPWCTGVDAPDRGWVNTTGFDPRPQYQPSIITYEFTDMTATSVAGQACTAAPIQLAEPVTSHVDPKGLDRLLGDIPFAVGVAKASAALPLIEKRDSPAWVRIFGELIREQRSELVTVAAVGGDFGGRLKGIKIPAVLCAVPVKNETNTVAWMSQALDRLNARYRWGLVAHEVPAPGARVFALEGTASSFFSSLTLEEKPAFAVCDGWLLMSSSLGSLSKIVERYYRAEPKDGRWAADLDEVDAPAYAWMDLANGGKALRLAITTYSLKLLFEDAQGSQKTRQQLNEAKAWIDSLVPLQAARLWMRADGKTMEIKFRAGE